MDLLLGTCRYAMGATPRWPTLPASRCLPPPPAARCAAGYIVAGVAGTWACSSLLVALSLVSLVLGAAGRVVAGVASTGACSLLALLALGDCSSRCRWRHWYWGLSCCRWCRCYLGLLVALSLASLVLGACSLLALLALGGCSSRCCWRHWYWGLSCCRWRRTYSNYLKPSKTGNSLSS